MSDKKDGKGAEDTKEGAAPAAPAPKETAFQRACKGFGLHPTSHVLSTRADGEKVVIVTKGGRKLRWPEDEGVKLSDSEKDGVPRDTPHRDMAKKAAAARPTGQE